MRPPRREQRKIEPWQVERVEAVLAARPDRRRAVGVVAAGCGLRQGEAFALRARDVDFLWRQLHVEQQLKLVGGRVLLAPPKMRLEGRGGNCVRQPVTAAVVRHHRLPD